MQNDDNEQTQFTVRVTKQLRKALEAVAVEEDRSLNQQVVRILKEHPLIKAELEKINRNKNTKQN